MSTQKFLECISCGEAIDVSEVANEHNNCGYFHDGAEIDIPCLKCNYENTVEVQYHVSYKPMESAVIGDLDDE